MKRANVWLSWPLLAGGLLVSCDTKSQAYCTQHPEDIAVCGMPDASSMLCTSSAECAPKVCDLTGSMVCVQCTTAEPAACTGAMPICLSNACQKCTTHGQCPSVACLPDGSCAAEPTVAYLDPAGTDNAICSKAMPCTKLTKALATSRPYVKFNGTTNDHVSILNQNVTLLAEPGARLVADGDSLPLDVTGSSQVAIYDLEISGGSPVFGSPGLNVSGGTTATVLVVRGKLTGNGGAGVLVRSGSLTISQSTITGNTGPGVQIIGSVTFDITNSVITNNGTSTNGGVRLGGIAGAGTHRVDFNTISSNVGPGIYCESIAAPLTFANDIVFGNSVTGGQTQIFGSANCAASYSDVGPDAAIGVGNINAVPNFVNAVQGNYHLAAGSPCKDAADPSANLAVDFDGDARPQGAARDIGADEIKP